MAIVRRDNIKSATNGHLYSVVVENSGSTAIDAENGLFVEVGALMEGQREARHGKVGENATALVCAPELMYDERLNHLDEFVIEAGTVVRAFELQLGDIFTITADGFTSGNIDSLAVGTKVIVDGTNGKLKAGTGGKIEFEVFEAPTFELHRTMKSVTLIVVEPTVAG